MKQMSLVFGLSLAFLLFNAAIVANIGSKNMPEMRGAWIAQSLR
jgi:hypothetical protein